MYLQTAHIARFLCVATLLINECETTAINILEAINNDFSATLHSLTTPRHHRRNEQRVDEGIVAYRHRQPCFVHFVFGAEVMPDAPLLSGGPSSPKIK
jgi:hypothetical protein